MGRPGIVDNPGCLIAVLIVLLLILGLLLL
jgi:hypothetical protein